MTRVTTRNLLQTIQSALCSASERIHSKYDFEWCTQPAHRLSVCPAEIHLTIHWLPPGYGSDFSNGEIPLFFGFYIRRIPGIKAPRFLKGFFGCLFVSPRVGPVPRERKHPTTLKQQIRANASPVLKLWYKIDFGVMRYGSRTEELSQKIARWRKEIMRNSRLTGGMRP